jgi:hypothetical protein
VVLGSLDGVGWEAVVKASLVLALVFVIGFAHQQQLQHGQFADDARLGDLLARVSTGGDAYASADVDSSETCLERRFDQDSKGVCIEITPSPHADVPYVPHDALFLACDDSSRLRIAAPMRVNCTASSAIDSTITESSVHTSCG